MPNILEHLFTVPVSSAQVAVSSDPWRTANEDTEVQFILAPGNLCHLQISQDRVNWATAIDNSGIAITNLGAVARSVATLAEYARLTVNTDAGAPRAYAAVLKVRKEIQHG
jgi:hypothetical protein